MTRIFTLAALPALALFAAACGETGEDAETNIIAAGNEAQEANLGLEPPQRDAFAEAYAAGCPAAEEISTAVCVAGGIGGSEFVCEFGLGNDEFRRYEATLVENEAGDAWTLADPDAACAQGAE